MNDIPKEENCGQPAISVDTKKKELIGNYKNLGLEYCQKGCPIKVNDHDFPDSRLGKVVPYGIYDIGKNKGWVSVGISADTAQFAVNTIRTWWYKMGIQVYPGLEVQAVLDENEYQSGIKVEAAEIKKLNIQGAKFHPEWNCTIRPHLL